MSSLATRHEPPRAPGIHALPAEELNELRFALVRAEPGSAHQFHTGDSEAVLVVLESAGGSVTVEGERFELPDRDSVFASPPSGVYAPPSAPVSVNGPLLAGVFMARANGDAPSAYAVMPEDVQSVERGSGNFRREVRDIVTADRPASRLLVGETINPPGNWSSSPPHKHDRHAPPEEAELEEIYLYRVDPGQGFGIQMSYSSDPPEELAFPVHDLDVVAIPRGYHPVVAGPGYSLYYLWGLAGRGRELLWNPDPDHAWVDVS
ncbi:MAG: 5-deoxy-glucuronate isomerase [Thermoleophilaceae bacterium]